MPVATKHETHRTHPRESSFLSLLSGWAQQGVEGLFATQRILIDLAMRQNASVMNLMRERLSDPSHAPAKMLAEMASEGVTNFVEAQKVLLHLAQQQNEIVMNGVKERVGDSTTAVALTDLLRNSLDTFIDMQQEYLKIADKQTHTWLEAAKTGKVYQPDKVVEMARQGIENFVRAQKRFLDVVAEETTKVAGGKHSHAPAKKMKKTELSHLAKQATDSFIDAQKKLFDLAGRQMSVNVKTAGEAINLVRPFPLPLADLTREGVKSYVDAQKALMDVMLKPRNGHKPASKTERHVKRPIRPVRAEAHHAAHATA